MTLQLSHRRLLVILLVCVDSDPFGGLAVLPFHDEDVPSGL